jgi:hypothetical protein
LQLSIPLALLGHNIWCFPLDRHHIGEYVKHPRAFLQIILGAPDGRFERTRCRLLCPSWHRMPSRRFEARGETRDRSRRDSRPRRSSRAKLGSCP